MQQFGWSETTMGLLQSVFFYGFTASHLPGGWLADRLGGRRVLAAGVLVWSVATGLMPLGTGFASFAVLRLALGLGEGMNMPAILNLIARWFPAAERTRATAIVVTGIQTGTLVAMPLSAWIATRFGWPAIFYAYAVLGAVWLTLWIRWPEEPQGRAARTSVLPAAPVPWRLLLGSRAVWAILLTTFSINWTVWFVHSWLPTYFMRVHGFSLRGSGLVATLPNLAMIVAGLAAGVGADRLLARGVSPTRVRKGILATGFTAAIGLLLLLPRLQAGPAAIACLCGALAAFALGSTMVVVNGLDLSPAHAGVIIGLQGTAGNIAGMISPALGGAIVARTASWDWNFYLIAALLAAGLIVWTSWASGEPLVIPSRARP
jgi:ACS family sodium-dependent inorganic phosphate cotransporter